MAALGPKETDPDAWIRWLKEALGLLARRPGLVAAWTLGLLVLVFVSHRIAFELLRGFAFFFLAVLGLGVFVRIAALADDSKRRRVRDLVPDNSQCVLAIGVAAILFALLLGFQPSLETLVATFRQTVEELGVWSPVDTDGFPAREPLRSILLGVILVPGALIGFAALSALAVLLLLGQWFLIPMMVLHSPPLPPAMVVSAKAYPLNPVPMAGLSGVLLVGFALVLLTAGWLGLVLVPFFGAVLYAAYRDVFMGQAENSPVAFLEDDSSMAQRPSALGRRAPGPRASPRVRYRSLQRRFQSPRIRPRSGRSRCPWEPAGPARGSGDAVVRR